MSEAELVVYSVQHRAFGKQVCVQFSEDFVVKLTQSEASSLSLALFAVRDGISEEREIYMSPIGSDKAFSGTVHSLGISVAIPSGELQLDWLKVGLLSASLAEALGRS